MVVLARLLSVILLANCVASVVSAKTLRLGLITPPSHTWTQAAINFGKELEEESDGVYTLYVYPSRQLGNEAQMLQLLQTGALDLAILTAAEVSNRVPEFGALYTPYLAQNMEQVSRVLRSSVANRLLEKLPEEIGVVGLGFGAAGMRQILSKRSIDTADQMIGKKLRITPFTPIKDFYRLTGAAPTPVPLASVYEALANGQIDMLDMDLELILKLKYHELAETLILSNHMMFPSVAMMSGRVWGSMPEQDRVMIERLMRKHMGWILDTAELEEQGWEQQARSLDISIIDAGPEFFGAAVTSWESAWHGQAQIIRDLKNTVEKGL